MTDTGFPLRVRLHGGRNIHAAKVSDGGEEPYTVTACGYVVGNGNDFRAAATAVSCRACIRRIRRATP